jgi:RNA polymerase sigma factor (sigma-70 family)
MPPPATDAALHLIDRHGSELMATARKWAATPEDAEDAYQRGLEILLTKAPTTDADELVPWLKTVVKHEAYAAHRQRERHTPPGGTPTDLDTPGEETAHDHVVQFERLHHGAEALRGLKPQEVRALVLKAEGLSYQEICEETGWTYTKVNRALAEGRKAFAERLDGIQSGAECERLAPILSAVADGEAGAEDLALLRPHLRTCLACRARLREYRAAPAKVAALVPGGGFALLAWLRDAFHSLAAHKLAAAASTAVLAGGGAVTVATIEAGGDRPEPRPTLSGSADPPPNAVAAPLTAPPRREERSRPTRPRSEGHGRAKRSAESHTPAAPRATASPPAAGEFAPDPAPVEPAATEPEQPASAASSAPPVGGEFAP